MIYGLTYIDRLIDFEVEVKGKTEKKQLLVMRVAKFEAPAMATLSGGGLNG